MPVTGENKPKPYDKGMWVEAIVTHCLAQNDTPEQARDFVLGSVIAQTLCFWRHSLPEPWGTLSQKWEYIAIMRLVYEPGPWVTGDQFDDAYRPHREQIRNALQKNTWEAYASLPDDVWDWLGQITGLSREDWQHLPDEAVQMLDSHVICPTCGADGPLRKIGVVTEPNNPHFIGTRLHVNCVQCSAGLSFDASERRVRPISVKWMKIVVIGLVVLLGGLLLVPLFALFRGSF